MNKFWFFLLEQQGNLLEKYKKFKEIDFESHIPYIPGNRSLHTRTVGTLFKDFLILLL